MLSFDAKLVNRTLQGDNTAFDRLVQQYQVGLLNRALSEVHNRSEAEGRPCPRSVSPCLSAPGNAESTR